MPGGRGYGRGRGSGRGRGQKQRIRRFLEPCLLVLLHREQAHGYSLIDELKDFGFDPDRMDPSLLYRALRDLEAQGLVEGEWDSESLGPQRRVYTVTPDGEARLEDWICELRSTRQHILALEQAYEKIKSADKEMSLGKEVESNAE